MTDIEVIVEYMDIEFIVRGTYEPLVRGVHTLSNGDPGYPDEGGFIDEIEIYIDEVDVTDVLSSVAFECISERAYEVVTND